MKYLIDFAGEIPLILTLDQVLNLYQSDEHLHKHKENPTIVDVWQWAFSRGAKEIKALAR